MSKPLPEKCTGIITDEVIRREFLTKKNRINGMMVRRCYNGREPRAKEYIENRYADSKSFKESVYRIVYNIEVRPVCKYCGKELKFVGYFPNTCSPSCAQRYSPNNTWRSKEGQMKCEMSRKKTLQKRYGVDNPGQIAEVRQKVIKTCQEKYGVDNVFQRKDIIQSFKDRLDQINRKKYLTHKKNNSFNDSKIEIETYNLLLTKFNDVIHQYKDNERYPFSCDFYIPSLDLFIELNYHWTHGGHLFNNNNTEDLKLIEYWKSKHTKYYSNAINTWTNLDVRKYKIAKKNNLNYLVFYDHKNFLEWFEKQ